MVVETETRRDWSKVVETETFSRVSLIPDLHPYIYKANGICEITKHDLTVEASIAYNNPRTKDVLTRHNRIKKIKEMYAQANRNKTFQSTKEISSLPELFDSVKNGSKTYKGVLLEHKKNKNSPSRNK